MRRNEATEASISVLHAFLVSLLSSRSGEHARCVPCGSGCRAKERVLNRLFGRLDRGEEQGRDGVIGQQFHVVRESFVSVSIRTCGAVENAMASSPLLFEAAPPDYARPKSYHDREAAIIHWESR
jgi:hypothetical protein